MSLFGELLLLLAAAVAAVALCRRWHVPVSLGYLAVGALLGPHALGGVSSAETIHGVAEFGLVFLLFAIGLNFSLPQLYALRHVWLGLGTGQVVLSTVALAAVGWALGLPAAAALVLGAAWAQSSTSLIGRQLEEQGEQHSRHGRLALAMSVFQDVTAVPIVVIVPVLGAAAVAQGALGGALALALLKALAAFALVYLIGRRLLRPLFHAVAARHSAELFTLTVLLVALAAGALTEALGLSLAFGAFLAGMMLGDTEFRHQIEASIRPFRDVLLGLFFAAIGMLFEPRALPAVWPWALGGAALLLAVKIVLVAALVRVGGADRDTALRTALTLAVGGEFGLAVLALALTAGALEPAWAQAGLAAILASMVAGSLPIRYNAPLARALGARTSSPPLPPAAPTVPADAWREHTIVCGYGRIGQNVARLVREEGGTYVALDLDAQRVREAHAAGEPVYYGDATELPLLEAVGLAQARLVVVAHDDADAALRLLRVVRPAYPRLPVMVRTRDDAQADALRAAGATEVVAETVEAGLTLAAHALWLLHVPAARIARRLRAARGDHYRLLRELFRGDEALASDEDAERLHAVALPAGAAAVGCRLDALALGAGRVAVTALLRDGRRHTAPPPDTVLAAGDALVLFGAPDDLLRAESRLLVGPAFTPAAPPAAGRAGAEAPPHRR